MTYQWYCVFYSDVPVFDKLTGWRSVIQRYYRTIGVIAPTEKIKSYRQCIVQSKANVILLEVAVCQSAPPPSRPVKPSPRPPRPVPAPVRHQIDHRCRRESPPRWCRRDAAAFRILRTWTCRLFPVKSVSQFISQSVIDHREYYVNYITG